MDSNTHLVQNGRQRPQSAYVVREINPVTASVRSVRGRKPRPTSLIVDSNGAHTDGYYIHTQHKEKETPASPTSGYYIHTTLPVGSSLKNGHTGNGHISPRARSPTITHNGYYTTTSARRAKSPRATLKEHLIVKGNDHTNGHVSPRNHINTVKYVYVPHTAMPMSPNYEVSKNVSHTTLHKSGSDPKIVKTTHYVSNGHKSGSSPNRYSKSQHFEFPTSDNILYRVNSAPTSRENIHTDGQLSPRTTSQSNGHVAPRPTSPNTALPSPGSVSVIYNGNHIVSSMSSTDVSKTRIMKVAPLRIKTEGDTSKSSVSSPRSPLDTWRSDTDTPRSTNGHFVWSTSNTPRSPNDTMSSKVSKSNMLNSSMVSHLSLQVTMYESYKDLCLKR